MPPDLTVGLFLKFNSNHVLAATFPRHSLMCSPPVAVMLFVNIFGPKLRGEEKYPSPRFWVTNSSDGEAVWR